MCQINQLFAPLEEGRIRSTSRPNLSASEFGRESFPFWDRWGSSGFKKIGLIFSKAIIFAKKFTLVGSESILRWPPQETANNLTWVFRSANKGRQIFLQSYFKKK